MKPRAYVETWGCQMNLHQSEGLSGILEAAGYALVDHLEEADVVVFNGCMVRQKAEEKVFGRIGAVVELKRSRSVLLGVGGCLGQIHGADLLKRFASIDFVFGSSGHSDLPGLIEEARTQRVAVLSEPVFDTVNRFKRSGTISGMVTITEGCSNFCTYCIVPYARGPMRSRPEDLILSEVMRLREQGYREVLLLGQNVNAYGTDLEKAVTFPELLSAVADTGIERVRFTTSHPKDMSETVFRVMAKRENVCRHLHLACQSGSDAILKAMNRSYDRRHYMDIVKSGRKWVPDLNITTDIIVGFPGETDGDFERTMTLLEEARFGSVFAAKYSPRPNTRGAELPDDVPQATKEERLERILQRQREIALEENGRFVGNELAVLIEGRTKRGELFGRGDDHRTVICPGDAEMGEFVTVRIAGASASSLSGGILERECVGGMT